MVTRLLRLPAENRRRFDEASDKLDELRALAPVVHELHQQLGVLNERIQNLERQIRDAATGTRRVHEEVEAVSVTASHIAERLAVGDPSNVADGPLVSVVVPCRDRARSLEVALRSVVAQTYERWECVVVDDGSKDDLECVVGHIGDDRIRLVAGPANGVAAARNTGLAASGGDIVTFLDSDNWWLPRRLESIVGALAHGALWAVDRQLVLRRDGNVAQVRASDKPLDQLELENFIDVGALAVRDRELRFDESLPRLSDWELVRRLAAREAPVRIPHVGVMYDERDPERISIRVPFGPSYHQIRSAAIGRPATGLRVLLTEWHFPQLTETYIQADVAGLQALGATVEAWSEEDVHTAYDPGIPVHRGPLADALDAVAPDVVLSHWIHVGRDHRALLRSRGIPHAIRGHGFDHDPGVLDELMRERDVVVHLFPHLAGRWAEHPTVSCDPVAFDPQRVRPSTTKDRRLVLRIAAGLLTKDIDTFLLAAKRCPDHRFVLVLGRAYLVPERTDELVRRAAELGSPVEILEDLPHDEAAALTEQAGIYVHTHGVDHPMGMPMSIAESMATGSYVIARDLPGIAGYGRDAVDRYTGSSVEERADHAAALVNATLAWDDARWEAAAQRSLDVAWVHHPADLVVARMLEVWRERLGVLARG